MFGKINLFVVAVLTLFVSEIKTATAQLTPQIDSIPMSDGRKLAADVYIPSGVTSGEVILVQTPYNRLYYHFGLPLGVGLNLNSSPYIFVVLDWRGFYGSSAAAYSGAPTLGADGYDAVEWIAQQTWSNGKVGTWGPSALGRVQFQTAEKHPPHLVCICPLVAAPQYDYEEYFPNGCIRTEYVQQLSALGFGLQPLLMANTVHNAVWTFSENTNYYPDSIAVPCMMIGGWYDHTIEFMLRFFTGLQTQSPVGVRASHRLLMGPWVHGGNGIANVGSATQGQLSYPNASHWKDSLTLLYFNYYLKNAVNGWNTSPAIQYYQMGENTWQSTATWAPAGTTNVDFYFHKNKLIDNSLPANSTDSLHFTYNPTSPSPTIGGCTLRSDLEQGPYDQTDSVENRNDILVFTTNTLTQNAVMKGNATVHLKVASNRKDTDFDIRLTDVYPDGRSMLVNDEVYRMRFRNGNTAADTAAMIPNTIYDCAIKLPTSCITFLAGHKIRVDVTSSNYPKYNRNMNTGGNMYPGNNLDSLQNPLIATNTVFVNNTNTSYISMPLVNYVLGVEDLKVENGKLEVYPNPAGEWLMVNCEWLIGNATVNIYDVLGRVYCHSERSEESKSIAISVGKLSSGIYFLKATDEKGNTFNTKFVKE